LGSPGVGRQLLVVAVLAVVGACTTTTTVTQVPGGGPSRFQMGFEPRPMIQEINALPNGPRCPAEVGPLSNDTGNGSAGPWSRAATTLSCTDSGDGTALRQAWSTQIAAQLQRSGVSIGMTATADGVTQHWDYAEGSRRGFIEFNALPAPDDKFWVQIWIIEPQ
jgi:hypothetical protein